MTHLPLLLLVILPLLFAGLACYRVYALQKRQIKTITDEYAELVTGATRYQVGYFSRYDLAQNAGTRAAAASTAVLSSRQRIGYFFVKDASATFIASGQNSQSIAQTFTPADFHITLFDHAGISIGLPSYIRFSSTSESLYLAPKTKSGRGQHQAARDLFQNLSRHFPTIPLAEPIRGLRKPGVAALGIAGTALVALLILWFKFYGRPLDPIKYLAVMPDASVLVVGDTHLLHLSPDGDTRLEERTMADLGFMDGPMGLQVEPQGTVLMGGRQEKTIARCDPATWQCQTLPGLAHEVTLFQGAFTLAVDPDAPRLLANDIERHRILELDLDGRLIRTVLDGNTLCAPQHIAVRNGHLIVVNTQHHKVQRYTLDDPPDLVDEWLTVKQGRSQITCQTPSTAFFHSVLNLFRKPEPGEPAKPFALSGSRKVWPILATQEASGAWWVANASQTLYWADVLRFETPTSPPKRVINGRDHDPVAILLREQDVLIADLAEIEIMRFDLEGKFLGKFGDRALDNPRDAYHERERRVNWVFLGGLGGFFFLMIALAGILMRVTERRMKWLAEQDPMLQT